MNKKILHKLQEIFFDIFTYISFLLLLLSSFGLSITYLYSLDYYIRIYICLFLIWRFNPFRKYYEFTELDRKIAFSAGLFILTTTTLNKYLELVKEKV